MTAKREESERERGEGIVTLFPLPWIRPWAGGKIVVGRS